MKKLVLASTALGGAALVVFGASGTFAAFSDSSVQQTPTAEAGTLFVEGSEVVESSAFDTGNLAPGQSVTYVSTLTNGGTVDGQLTGVFELALDRENGCTPAEAPVDSSCGTADSDGEIAEKSVLDVYYGTLADGATCEEASRPGASLTFVPRAVNGSPMFQRLPLAAGESFCAVYVLTIPQEVGNEIQSDDLSFRAKYYLDQAPDAAA